MLASQVVGILILSLFGCGSTYRVSRFYEDRGYPSLPLNDNRAYRPRPLPFYEDYSPNQELPFYEDNSPNQELLFYEEVGPSEDFESESPDEEFRLEDEVAGNMLADECLHAHNILRRRHQNTLDLVWNPTLAKYAEEWAKKLAKNGSLSHDKKVYNKYGLGENVFLSGGKRKATCVDAVFAWYKEIKYYDFNTGKTRTKGKMIGHFTQIVSTRSKEVGVGIATARKENSDRMKTFVVAKYAPFGNYKGQNLRNVNRVKPGEPQIEKEDLVAEVYALV